MMFELTFNTTGGALASTTFRARASFFTLALPALYHNSITGDVTLASRTLNAFFLVWRDMGFLPEQFNHGEWGLQDQGVGRVCHFCHCLFFSLFASFLSFSLSLHLVNSSLHRFGPFFLLLCTYFLLVGFLRNSCGPFVLNSRTLCFFRLFSLAG